MLGGLIALAVECGIGYATWHWLWTTGYPSRFVTPKAPERISDLPITLDSDWRGLV